MATKTTSTSKQVVKYDRKNEKVKSFGIGKSAGIDHGVYVQWKHAKSNQASGYEYDWEYADGNRLSPTAAQKKKGQQGDLKWFPGTNGTIDVVSASVGGGWFRHTWTAPDTAILARCRVRPVSKEKTTSKSSSSNWKTGSSSTSVTYKYFSPAFTSYAQYDFRNNKLPTPTVTVTMLDNGTTAQISVSCNDVDCKYCTIEVSEHVGSDYKVVRTLADKTCNQSGTYNDTIPLGKTYYYRAYCGTVTSDSSKGNSSWSSRASATAKPPKPTFGKGDGASATGSDSAKVKWTAAEGASTYTVERVPDNGDLFNGDPSAVTSVSEIVGTTHLPTGLEPGHRWFFRVRAVNDTGEGDWSDIVSCLLATVPDAPTTYETEPSFMVGDEVTFRWTHNSEDASEQTAYEIELELLTSDGSSTFNATKSASEIPVRTDGSFDLPSDFAEVSPVQYEVLDGELHDMGYQLMLFRTIDSDTRESRHITCDYYDFANGVATVKSEYSHIPFVSDLPEGFKVRLFTYYSNVTVLNLSGTDAGCSPDDSSRSYALANISDGTDVRWRVRTKGAHDDWSPYSEYRSFSVYEQPSLTCVARQTDEGGDEVTDDNPLTAFPLAVSLDASGGGNAVVAYHVKVISTKDLAYIDAFGVERNMGVGELAFEADYLTSDDPFTAIISSGEANLRDAGSYQVVADVAMASGMRSESDPWEFSVDFDVEVPEPTAMVAFDEDTLTADILPVCYAMEDGEYTEDFQDGVTLSVYRIDDDGSLVLLMAGIANDGTTTVVDPHAQFGECWYHIVATDTATGVCNFADAYDFSKHDTCVIQWNERWQEAIDPDDLADRSYEYAGYLIDGLYNLQFDENGEPEVEEAKYIGREHPVSYYGTQLGYTATYQTEFPRGDQATLDLCRKLMGYLDDCYIREPSGTGFWAHVTTSLSRTEDSQAISFTVNASRVDRDDSALEEV